MIIDESRTAKGFTPGDQVPGRTIEEIFIHHWGEFGQTHDGVVDFFCNGPGATSAHFVVSGGRVNCIVSPSDVAWHAGVWEHNVKSVGIECRPEADDDSYREISALVRWLRSQYGDLPLVPHRAVHATACPGIYDLDRIDQLARQPEIQVEKEEEDMPSAKEIADEIFNRDLPWAGFDGSFPKAGRTTTTLQTATAFNDTLFASLHNELSALRELISQLAVKQGVTIDYDAIAKAVNDDAAKRLSK